MSALEIASGCHADYAGAKEEPVVATLEKFSDGSACGFLLKRSGSKGDWEKRFFKWDGRDRLSYYASEQSMRKGKIDLQTVDSVCLFDDKECKYAFELRTQSRFWAWRQCARKIWNGLT